MGSANNLIVRSGWKLSQVELSGSYLVVEHAFRTYYRVVLSGGTKMTAEMMPGRCVRIAECIAAQLNLPLQVPQELRDQIRASRRNIFLIVLLVGATIVMGVVGFFLFRP